MIRPVRSSGESTWIIVSPWVPAGGRPAALASGSKASAPRITTNAAPPPFVGDEPGEGDAP